MKTTVNEADSFKMSGTVVLFVLFDDIVFPKNEVLRNRIVLEL